MFTTEEMEKLVPVLAKHDTHIPLQKRARRMLEAWSRVRKFDTLPPLVKAALSEALFDDVIARFSKDGTGAGIRISLLNLNEFLEVRGRNMKLAQGVVPGPDEVTDAEVESLLALYFGKNPGSDERVTRRLKHNGGRRDYQEK